MDTSARPEPLAQTGYRLSFLRTFARLSKPRFRRTIRYGKMAVKGLLTTGLQSATRLRVSRQLCPPHVRLHGFRVSGGVGSPRRTPQIHSQTSSHLRIATLAGTQHKRNHSQETVASSDFGQALATPLLTFLDCDLQTPHSSQQVAVGLPL